jgi:hypothetical protein
LGGWVTAGVGAATFIGGVVAVGVGGEAAIGGVAVAAIGNGLIQAGISAINGGSIGSIAVSFVGGATAIVGGVAIEVVGTGALGIIGGSVLGSSIDGASYTSSVGGAIGGGGPWRFSGVGRAKRKRHADQRSLVPVISSLPR